MIRKIFFALVVLFFSSSISLAQIKAEKKVAEAVQKLRLAMIDGNKATLEQLVWEQLSYGHSSGHIDNKKEFVEKLSSGKSDFVTMELTDQSIIIKGRTAIVRHKLNASTNDGGKPGEVHLTVMLVWQKQVGAWKLLARQAIKLT